MIRPCPRSCNRASVVEDSIMSEIDALISGILFGAVPILLCLLLVGIIGCVISGGLILCTLQYWLTTAAAKITLRLSR